jgi:hypothetical protein
MQVGPSKETLVKDRAQRFQDSKVPCPKCDRLMSPKAQACSRHNGDRQTGDKNKFYKGGRSVSKSGYVTVSGYRGHPNATKGGGIAEHVLVMSGILGRALVPGESVHHKNGIRHDNRPQNLELWVSRQPVGQRVEDRVFDAIETLRRYAPETLKETDV